MHPPTHTHKHTHTSRNTSDHFYELTHFKQLLCMLSDSYHIGHQINQFFITISNFGSQLYKKFIVKKCVFKCVDHARGAKHGDKLHHIVCETHPSVVPCYSLIVDQDKGRCSGLQLGFEIKQIQPPSLETFFSTDPPGH